VKLQSRIVLSATALFIIAPSAVSCRFFKSKSAPQEAPNASNQFSNLGIPNNIFWKDIRESVKAAMPTPWSDSYWPLYARGMADRWLARETQSTSVKAELETLWDQLTNLETTLTSKDPNKIALLSPAEKYDFLVNKGVLPSSELKAEIKKISDSYKADANVQALLTRRKTIAKKMREIEKRFTVVASEGERLYKIYTTLIALNDPSNAAETSALENKIQSLEAESAALGAQFDELQTQASQLESETQKAGRFYIEQTTSLLRNLARTWPMLADSWQQWSEYAGIFEGEWTWMGHCHGWAAAAYMEKTPQHSVVVKANGQEILFTEGDIRGLLTKIWADNPPEALFASKRCNSEKFDTDRRGRIVDGKICYSANTDTCQGKPDGKIIFMRNERNGVYEFTESIYAKTSKIAVATESLAGDHVRVAVYETIDDAAAGNRNFVPAVMHISTGCRDTNPATFHAAITKLIAEKKTGFVLDMTRSDQVWNQPAFAYESEYIPIKKKDGTSSTGGDLVPVSDVLDPFMKYRAPGTAYLVQVKTVLKYGSENGPRAAYTASDDTSVEATYVYTLELDKNEKLIGGEWGLLPLAGEKNSKARKFRGFIGGDAPDFLWKYSDDAKPTPGAFSYDIIKKIHNCSLADKGIVSRKFGNLPELKVVECAL
jgi:hypothetical protein